MGSDIVRLLQEYNISPPQFELGFRHAPLAEQPCSNMVTGISCSDHWIPTRAYNRSLPYHERYRSAEGEDHRFVSKGSLTTAVVPVVGTAVANRQCRRHIDLSQLPRRRRQRTMCKSTWTAAHLVHLRRPPGSAVASSATRTQSQQHHAQCDFFNGPNLRLPVPRW